jgi:hypothetical protein
MRKRTSPVTEAEREGGTMTEEVMSFGPVTGCLSALTKPLIEDLSIATSAAVQKHSIETRLIHGIRQPQRAGQQKEWKSNDGRQRSVAGERKP